MPDGAYERLVEAGYARIWPSIAMADLANVGVSLPMVVRDGFGESPKFSVLLATWDDAPIGFALYFTSYSTWRGRACLYLEDLFVRPTHRGRGAGLALMRALAREALHRDCARFVWQVLDWNAPAIAFYERLGASIQREWLPVRLEGPALEALARSDA